MNGTVPTTPAFFCLKIDIVELAERRGAPHAATTQHSDMAAQQLAHARTPGTGREEYEQDGPVARRIAAVTPYFPFKGIDRFYDIGGFL